MQANLFSTLPNEINYQIIKEQHPYFTINGYCKVDKINRQYCEVSKYEILQEWVYPGLSIKELKEQFPGISLEDVVNLSLVYNPIVEIFVKDLQLVNNIPVTVDLILMNAFYLRNTDVMNYIIERIPIHYRANPYDKTQLIDVLFNLCFVDNYVEPLQYAYDRALSLNFDAVLRKEIITYLHIMYTKLGTDFELLGEDEYSLTRWRTNETLLWNLELWCEYQIIYYTLSGIEAIFERLTGDLEPQPNDYLDYCYYIAYLVGKDNLDSILSKYIDDPDVTIYTYIQDRYEGNIIISLYTSCMSYAQLLLEPELAVDYIKKDELAGYYLLSGLYDWYISAKLTTGIDVKEEHYPSSGDIFGNRHNWKINEVTASSYEYDYKYNPYDLDDDDPYC